jgi:hypothetical protein
MKGKLMDRQIRLQLTGSGSEFQVDLLDPLDLTRNQWRISLVELAMENYRQVVSKKSPVAGASAADPKADKKPTLPDSEHQQIHIYCSLCSNVYTCQGYSPLLDVALFPLKNDGSLVSYSPTHIASLPTVCELVTSIRIRMEPSLPSTTKFFIKLQLEL